MLALWGSQLWLEPAKVESRMPGIAGIPIWDPNEGGIKDARDSWDPVIAGIPIWDPNEGGIKDARDSWDPVIAGIP